MSNQASKRNIGMDLLRIIAMAMVMWNHTTVFEKTYRFIFYLSENIALSSNNIVSARNVYNNYGLTFFFDLFFHECFVRYQANK